MWKLTKIIRFFYLDRTQKSLLVLIFLVFNYDTILDKNLVKTKRGWEEEMKKDQLRLWTKQLSLSFWIVAPLVALVFGASGLSIALKNATASKQVTVAQVKSPYLYGQITNSVDLLSAVQAFWPPHGEFVFTKKIDHYQKTILLPATFFSICWQHSNSDWKNIQEHCVGYSWKACDWTC